MEILRVYSMIRDYCDLIFSNSFLSNNRSCCDKAGLYEGEAITIAIDFSAFQFSTRRLNVTDA